MSKRTTNEEWVNFIIMHFKQGTSSEISAHIEMEAERLGFGENNNNNKKAKVRQILPKSTINEGPSPTRENIRKVFLYNPLTRIYSLPK